MHMRYIVYVSRLRAASGPDPLPSIVGVSRENNVARSIGGALLFDGRRFCQYIEGDVDELGRTFEAIEADDRHEDVRVLADGFIESRRFEHWSMACVRAATSDVIDTIERLPPSAVGDGFAWMVDRCEVEA